MATDKAKQLLDGDKPFMVMEEDEGVYNIMCVADFNEDGYLDGYEGREGYHITDYDIAARFRSWREAERWVDEREATVFNG